MISPIVMLSIPIFPSFSRTSSFVPLRVQSLDRVSSSVALSGYFSARFARAAVFLEDRASRAFSVACSEEMPLRISSMIPR